MTATDREPIRRSQLPPIPPPEWDHHTWFPTPDGGGDLVPGHHSRGVLIRRRVTWGDWEPVHPDHWAAESEVESEARAVRDCPACEAGIAHDEHCPTPETHNWGCGCPTDEAPREQCTEAIPAALARLRARLVADRDRAARNSRHAHTEQIRLVNDGMVAGFDTALRRIDGVLGEVDRSCGKPRAGAPSQAADRP